MKKGSIKTKEEIKIMEKGGEILREVLNELLDKAKPGMKTSELDELAEKEIRKRDAEPSFKKVPGYRWTICSCVNEIIVHGIPGEYVIKEGDVVGIDCGVFYEGFHTDSAWSVRAGGRKNDSTDFFLDTGILALENALKKVRPGNRIYDISQAIEKTVEQGGYSVVKSLVGHGVGRNLHEYPEIPGFASGDRDNSPEIVEGMTLAIEVIYNKGSEEIAYSKKDGWTITTKDGKISGLFEKTVAVTSHGYILLT